MRQLQTDKMDVLNENSVKKQRFEPDDPIELRLEQSTSNMDAEEWYGDVEED